MTKSITMNPKSKRPTRNLKLKRLMRNLMLRSRVIIKIPSKLKNRLKLISSKSLKINSPKSHRPPTQNKRMLKNQL